MNVMQSPTSRTSWRALGQSLARVGRLARKELVEILCDRRTIFTLVLMPLLLYPLLSFAFRQFMVAFMVGGQADRPLRIGVLTEGDKRFVEGYLALGHDVPGAAGVVGLGASLPAPGPFLSASLLLGGRFGREPYVNLPRYDPKSFGPPPFPPIFVEVKQNLQNLYTAVSEGEIDVALHVTVPDSKRPSSRKFADSKHPLNVDWELFYADHLARSREVATYLEQHCALANARVVQSTLDALEAKLAALNAPDVKRVRMPAVPVRIIRMGSEARDTTPGLSMAALVPLILILMTITGAVYPAIDLTAGERERGTLEILVAAPVPRLSLLFAKYVAVVTVAMLTATLNLVMMLVTLALNGLTDQVFKENGVTLQLVAQLLFLLILFAAFFSAVLLALTSFARSFKEAQAYLIPLILASLGPGVIGIMPGLRLQGVLTVTPLLNIVLLARDLAENTAHWTTGLVVVVSTLAYAVAAISVAARVFGAEAVLYSEQSGWADLFRRPVVPRATASVSGALLCLALLFPAYFVVGSLLAQVLPEWQLLFQVIATALLFAAVPVAVCQVARIRRPSGLQLALPPLSSWLAALLLGAAAVPAIFYVLLFMREWELMFVTPQMEQQLRRLLIQGWRADYPLWVVMGAVALISVAEELFFRGFLFSALRAGASRRMTIVGSALLFGAFHFVPQFDRLVPSTLMGLLLGWVCWQTRSVLPGMVLHACYNILWIELMYEQTGPTGSSILVRIPQWWLLGAIPAALVGAGILWWFPARGQDKL